MRRFHREILASLIVFVCLAIAACSLSQQTASDSKPNILLIFADDQRADTIAALGNPVIKTPNLDRLVPDDIPILAIGRRRPSSA